MEAHELLYETKLFFNWKNGTPVDFFSLPEETAVILMAMDQQYEYARSLPK